jgi:thiamine biosynthesis lipoprotein ApbE
VVTLQDQAMSVSAVWPGNPHPTTDPRTGEVLDGPRRAVVVGPSARLADAWSTAALVLGKRPDGLGPDWTSLVT